VWALSNFRWSLLGVSVSSVEEWVQSLLLKLSSADINLVLMVCWVIWWSRNLKALNKAFLFPQQVWDFAKSYLSAFELACSSQLPKRLQQHSPWIPPPVGAVKINFDGAILDNGEALGLGVVARDSSGTCLFWRSVRISRKGPAIIAEALAAREVIILARRHLWQRVIVEGDCATLMKKLAADALDQSVIRPLIFYFKTVAAELNYVSCSLVSRSSNSVADRLAKLAVNLEGNVSVIPTELNSLLFGDLPV
ncbi:UNVERIFIED_CONTAM: hypothetical protein Sradi_2955000, partial [Sesamum radiatum]